MITEHLREGAHNAQTGRELCKLLQISARELTAAVEAERRAGNPICASTDPAAPGYFLPADKEELKRYCSSLFRRAGEIHKTRRACLKALDTLPDGLEDIEGMEYGETEQ